MRLGPSEGGSIMRQFLFFNRADGCLALMSAMSHPRIPRLLMAAWCFNHVQLPSVAVRRRMLRGWSQWRPFVALSATDAVMDDMCLTVTSTVSPRCTPRCASDCIIRDKRASHLSPAGIHATGKHRAGSNGAAICQQSIVSRTLFEIND